MKNSSNTQKAEVLVLREKIIEIIKSDPKKAAKAVIILTQWLSRSAHKNPFKKSA